MKLFNTDCVEALKELPENSVDAIVTDPPYFIGFMGKKWDAEKHIASHPDFWAECLRVLKPGGHCLAFGHSRTHHRLFTAIEDAGFVIKDTIMWMYGVGFPKSHNIGKTLQKKLDKITNEIKEFIKNEAKTTEEETELLLRLMRDGHLQKTKHISEKRWKVLLSFLSQQGLSVEEKTGGFLFISEGKGKSSVEGRNNLQESERKLQGSSLCSLPAGVDNDGEERRLHNGTPTNDGSNDRKTSNQKGSGPPHRPRPTKQQKGKSNVVSLQRSAQALRSATDKAKQWEGWGTALKPAYEPICLAQKPKEGTYADNVLNYGVGGLNIDECRIGTNEDFSNVKPRTMMTNQGSVAKTKREGGTHNHNDAASLKEAKDKLQNLGRFPANVILDNEAGDLLDEQSGTTKGTRSIRRNKSGMGIHDSPKGTFGKGDVLGGYDDEGGASRFFYQAKSSKKDRNKYCEGLEEKKFVLNESIRDNDRLEGGVEGDLGWNKQKIRRNHHPTVKPIKLMDYLIRLITPAGGTVLDPFMGSGSTGIAAIEGGWDFIGCEKEKEYFEIATTRLQNCDEQKKDK